MEITKSLQEDIVKIQNELITAIQNHQVLVLRQQVSPSDNIKTQIEEVQRHIICLGGSQKILVNRLRNEIKKLNSINQDNIKHKSPQISLPQNNSNSDSEQQKSKSQDMGRSLLIRNINSHNHDRDKSLCKTSYNSEHSSDRKHPSRVRPPSADSSSEENRTPCGSPIHGNSDGDPHGVKRTLSEPHRSPSKRPKSTLQATPRPSSPVPARNKALDALSSSSEESLDAFMSHLCNSGNKIQFALGLGLVTKEVFNTIMKKRSERRRRRSNNQHHLYNNLWDLTLLQKRGRGRPAADEVDDASRDCVTSLSDSDTLCFICQKTGELQECRVCQTGCHVSCISNNICPACTHQASDVSPLVAEKKKELEQLRMSNKELHKSVAKLRERAKVLSASLVMQTATVNQLIAKEDKLHESIQKVKDFVIDMQQGPMPKTAS